MMWGNGSASLWMWLFGALVIIGVVLVVIVLVRVLADTKPSSRSVQRGDTARRILDERYAKGELTTEEYRERLSALGQGG